MPVSVRLQREAQRRAAEQGPPISEYEILDPHFVPDLNGEFAGEKVYQRGGSHFVRLIPSQAQYWIDQGAIRRAGG